MSDINKANLTDFFENLKVEFDNGLNAEIGNALRSAAMDIPSTSSQNKHAWLNQIPQVREWLGDRVVNNIQSNSLTVVNRKFESTIEMTREEIEDDEHGVYANLAGIMGNNARDFPDELLVEALLNGQTDTWADGTAVFSDSRTYGSNTIDNLTTTVFDEDGDGFNAAYALMMNYLGHNNKPLRSMPATLVYGADKRVEVFKVLQPQAQMLTDGSAIVSLPGGNANQGLVRAVQSPLLVDGYVDSKGNTHSNAGTHWFLIGAMGGVSGLAYQERKAPEFQTSRLEDDSDFVFANDKFQFGTRQRGEAFVTLPNLVVGNFATT